MMQNARQALIVLAEVVISMMVVWFFRKLFGKAKNNVDGDDVIDV